MEFSDCTLTSMDENLCFIVVFSRDVGEERNFRAWRMRGKYRVGVLSGKFHLNRTTSTFFVLYYSTLAILNLNNWSNLRGGYQGLCSRLFIVVISVSATRILAQGRVPCSWNNKAFWQDVEKHKNLWCPQLSEIVKLENQQEERINKWTKSRQGQPGTGVKKKKIGWECSVGKETQ